MSNRLDNFTDAAFAFAVTLLVIGGTDSPINQQMLSRAVAEVPAFAIGFTFIAMFWFAHLRWRKARGEGDWLSSLLSVLLVFLVLVYIQPLRAMARSFSSFLGGSGQRFAGDLGDLFLIYGAGFVAMAGATVALFLEAQRNADLGPNYRINLRGEMFIWLILAATGLTSTLFAAFEPTEIAAPMTYMTLPLSIGLFTWRYKWAPHDKPESEVG